MMHYFPSFPSRLALAGCLLVTLSMPLPKAAAQANRTRAADLDGGVGWIGTDKPLKLADLRGKIVVLDFWTLC